MYCREEKYDQFNGTLKCAYTYLADGTKVMAQDNASSSASNGYLYLGSMVFKKTGTSYAFESTDFGGGRIINVNGTLSPYYYATDHLGSVRAITDASGNVTERNDYYAFGKRMTTGGTYPVMNSNRWKYNGKEVQTTGNVNWLDYGAREYDEVTGRWTRPDPMSEKYYGTSGYVFCSENPVNRFDNTGTEDDWVKDSKGNIYWDSNATSQATTKNGETYLAKNGYDLTTYYRPDGTTSSVAFDLPAVTINGGYMSEHAKVMSNPVVQAEHEGQDAFLNHPVTNIITSSIIFVLTGGIETTVSIIGNIPVPIYRVFGGEAKALGSYWTPVNPRIYGRHYRDFAGLPNKNTGEFSIKAVTKLKNIKINTINMASPCDGNFGRLVPELKLKNPNELSTKLILRNY
jgi:RHS repeat-associated protein